VLKFQLHIKKQANKNQFIWRTISVKRA